MDDTLKNLMKKYVGNLVDTEEFAHLFCNDNSHLRNCIMLIKKYPELNNYLEIYLEKYDVANQIDIFGETPLHYSIYHLKNPIILNRTLNLLINAGANVNSQSIYGITPLHLALACGVDRENIKNLVLRGANVFDTKDSVKTPYDCMNYEVRKYLEIDETTQTIGIKTGLLTKSAVKLHCNFS